MGGCSYTRKQWTTLIIFGLADFCSAICISLQAPFYPHEAESKGATATQYGLVFGVFELTVFLVSPIYGKHLNRIGPKFIFNAGIFTTASCCILFGLLDKIENSTMFITLSFIIRIVEALGNAGFLTASFAIIAKEFPDNVATIFASLETFFGIGLIFGPTVGGALYQIGGYSLPFLVLGSGLICTAVLTMIVLPSHDDESCRKNSPSMGVKEALQVPSIAVAAYSIVSASCSLGFTQALLEPHLRRYMLKPVILGLVFIINGVVYALCAPVWGWLCDNHVRPKVVTAFASLLVIVGFSMLGPAPFLPLEPSLALICGALMVHGLGFGGEVVAGFVDVHREAVKNGFPDNLDTYGMVSGLWTSMFALGAFVGPSLAGVMYDHFGFSNASLLVVVMHIVLFILVCVFLASGRRGGVPANGESGSEELGLVKAGFDSTYGSGGSETSGSEHTLW